MIFPALLNELVNAGSALVVILPALVAELARLPVPAVAGLAPTADAQFVPAFPNQVVGVFGDK